MGLLCIIDGSYYVARGNATKTHLSSNGFPTSGIFFPLNMIGSDLTKLNPDYCCVVFDRSTKDEVPERNKIYPEYKENRKPQTEEDRVVSSIKTKQRRVVKDVLNMCGITSVFAHKGWEADDTIASLAIRASDANQRVLIMTGDKDIAQLVGSKIRVLDTKFEEGRPAIKDYWLDAMTVDRVQEKFGVPPNKIAELLALHGDRVDGVPGVYGITRETASVLITEYGSIKEVSAAYTRGELELGEKSKLLSDTDFLKRNLKLVRLNVNLIQKGDFVLDDYKIDKNNSQKEASKYLQSEFGFKDIPASLLKYLQRSSVVSSVKRRASMFD